MKWSEVVLLVGLFFWCSLSFITAQTVPTTIRINNTGPILLANIPDVTIYQNQNTTNIIDLDDYFRDDNGDTLIITYFSPANITVFVDSQNQVTFLPDTGFTGSSTMNFTVSDGTSSVTSNTFVASVGYDNEAPKWNNPQIDRTTVYQNYYITFTALWTDNVNLANYTLTLNQGSGWVNYSVTNFSGLVNASKTVVQISGSPGTLAYWGFYAYDWNGNSNFTGLSTFTINEFEITEDEFEEFIDESGPAVQGATAGPSVQEGITLEAFTVNTKNIRLTLRQGDATTKVIRITNLLAVPQRFTAELRGIGAMAVLSEKSFDIPAKGSYDLVVDFLIPKRQMPDEYYGSVVIGSEDRVVVPIVLDVKPFDAAISLEVTVPQTHKFVKVGKQVEASVVLKNLLDAREGTARIFYALKDFEGNIIDSANESIPFLNYYEATKSFTIPDSLSDGEYLFYAIAFFDDRIDLDSDNFYVGLRLEIYYYVKKLLYLIIFVVLLLIIIYLYLLYKRNKRKKQLLELYLLLNELRELVKDGKVSAAVEVYRRVKVAYGQRMPKEYLQNEEKLKLELDKFAKVLKETPIELVKTQEEKVDEEKKAQEKKKADDEKLEKEKLEKAELEKKAAELEKKKIEEEKAVKASTEKNANPDKPVLESAKKVEEKVNPPVAESKSSSVDGKEIKSGDGLAKDDDEE